MTDAVVATALVQEAMSNRALSESGSRGPERFDASPSTARCTTAPSRSTWAATPAYRCSSMPRWRTSSGLVTRATLPTRPWEHASGLAGDQRDLGGLRTTRHEVEALLEL